LCDLILGAQ